MIPHTRVQVYFIYVLCSLLTISFYYPLLYFFTCDIFYKYIYFYTVAFTLFIIPLNYTNSWQSIINTLTSSTNPIFLKMSSHNFTRIGTVYKLLLLFNYCQICIMVIVTRIIPSTHRITSLGLSQNPQLFCAQQW